MWACSNVIWSYLQFWSNITCLWGNPFNTPAVCGFFCFVGLTWSLKFHFFRVIVWQRSRGQVSAMCPTMAKFKQADRSGDCQCPNATLCAEVAQKAQNVAPAMFEVAIENPLVVHDTYVIEVSFIFIYIHTLMQYICRSRKHVPRGIHFIQNDCLGPGGAYLHSVFPVPPNCSYTLGTL
jgi:hypothetical protein